MGLPALDSIWCVILTETCLSPLTQAYRFGLCENTELRVCLTSSQHSPTLCTVLDPQCWKSHALLLSPHQALPRSILSSTGWQIPEPSPNTHKARQDTEQLWTKGAENEKKVIYKDVGNILICHLYFAISNLVMPYIKGTLIGII